jgi:hypothetical protein
MKGRKIEYLNPNKPTKRSQMVKKKMNMMMNLLNMMRMTMRMKMKKRENPAMKKTSRACKGIQAHHFST